MYRKLARDGPYWPPSNPMSNPSHGLLTDLIDRLDEMHGSIEGRRYPPGGARHSMDMAVGALTGLGVRQLRAASCLIDSGWAPESHSHARTVWEIAVDVWFLLSRSGEERHRLSRMYLGMSYLRAPAAEAYINVVDAGMMRESSFARAYREARDEFGKDFDPDDLHWSGMGKGEVRALADAEISRVLGSMQPMGLVSAILRSKALLFAFPSKVIHGDPAMLQLVPTTGNILRTTPLLGDRRERLGLATAVAAAFLLLTGANRRRGEEGATSTQTYNERVMAFLLED
jgi:hypothetical protein